MTNLHKQLVDNNAPLELLAYIPKYSAILPNGFRSFQDGTWSADYKIEIAPNITCSFLRTKPELLFYSRNTLKKVESCAEFVQLLEEHQTRIEMYRILENGAAPYLKVIAKLAVFIEGGDLEYLAMLLNRAPHVAKERAKGFLSAVKTVVDQRIAYAERT